MTDGRTDGQADGRTNGRRRLQYTRRFFFKKKSVGIIKLKMVEKLRGCTGLQHYINDSC